MYLNDIFESTYYMDENIVSKRVENLNEVADSCEFWYKALTENEID